jgi:thiamine biosynthesis lipoprotein
MTFKNYLLGYTLLFAGIAAYPSEPDPPLMRFSFTEKHMGTEFRIVFYAPDEVTAKKAAKAAFARIAELDGIMSDYKETSELMRLCKKAGGDPVPVSKELFFVLSKAQEISKLSDGAFDVTIGPVVRLWRVARRTKRLPNAEKLAQARALVGYQNLKLNPKDRTVQLTKVGMLLDLGGIAKGYTADEVLAVLRRFGITRALVAAGGDIAVGDAPPDATGWKVGIAPLKNPDSKPTQYVLLKNAAVSTSGDAEQHVVIDGKRYSHIVDPKTGLGLTGRRSATVIARNGITADSMTKPVSLLAWEQAAAIIEATEDAAALYLYETEKGIETKKTKRFHKYEYK